MDAITINQDDAAAIISRDSRFRRFEINPLVIFAGLQVLDVATTLLGLHGQGAVEANPFMRHFFVSFGPLAGLVIAKALTVSMILTYITRRFHPTKALQFVNVFFTGLVVWNLMVLGPGRIFTL
jgi:hypothetical protein